MNPEFQDYLDRKKKEVIETSYEIDKIIKNLYKNNVYSCCEK